MKTKLITALALGLFFILIVGILSFGLTSKSSAGNDSPLVVNSSEKQKVDSQNLTKVPNKTTVVPTPSPTPSPPPSPPPVRTTSAS